MGLIIETHFQIDRFRMGEYMINLVSRKGLIIQETHLTPENLANIMAFSALVISYFSYTMARESLALSRKQDERKEPMLSLYLEDSHYKDIDGNRLLSFSFKISNPTDSDNTISACDLKITYKRSDGTFGDIILPCDGVENIETEKARTHFFDIPCHIKAHGTLSGTIKFRLANEIMHGLLLEKYEVIFRDAHSLESRQVIFIMRGISE